MRVKVLLKIRKITYTSKQVVNIYIFYEINLWPFTVEKGFALRNSLFGAVKLPKNTVLININIPDMLLALMHAQVSPYLVVVGLVRNVIVFG